MFREMRRIKQQLPEAEAIDILKKSTSGVLAVLGDDDYPYAVPLSYVYKNDKLYFHCAITGHKLDAIAKNGKASFCVITHDEIHPEKFTTYYKSVIAFGTARVLTEDSEKHEAIEAIAEKYSPGYDSADEIASSYKRLGLIELKIEHLTGKEAKEFMEARAK